MKQRMIKSDSELVESAGSQGGQDGAEETIFINHAEISGGVGISGRSLHIIWSFLELVF